MAENIFNEKQDYIVAARDEVIKRDEYAANIDRMKQQQKKLSRSIASEEKSIADEIATTIKKRRQDIQSTYDDRLDDNRARKKKVANKRDKKKEERMDKRYHEETKRLPSAWRSDITMPSSAMAICSSISSLGRSMP